MSNLYRFIIICLVLFSILTVYVSIPIEDNYAKTSDEGYYFTFAYLISKNGIKQFPELAKVYIDNKEARLFPTPLRAGHILLTAFWFKLFPNTFVSLTQFSFLCYTLFLVASFFFARRHFGRDVAYIFALLLSSSPLIMAMARRALSDINGNLFWGLAIWLFLEFLERQSKIKYFIFILFYSFSIAVRESSLALLIFFVGFFFIYKYIYKRRVSNTYLLGIIFLPSILVGVSYVILFKGAGNVIGLVNAVLDTHFGIQTSKYALLFCTGPWYRYIIDYLLLMPVTTLLFIGYFSYTLLIRRIEWKIAYFMTYFTTVFIIFSNMKYSKVVRFVINLEMVISLFSVLMLYEIFKQKNEKYRFYLVFIAALAIFTVNYFSFVDIFCNKGVYDPITYNLLSVRKLIP